MARNLGLLRKEWVLYRSWIFAAFVTGFAILFILPLALSKGNRELITDELHFSFMLGSLVIGSLFILLQFLSSLRNDVHKKETWLHSTSSIMMLTGIKLLFSGIFCLVYLLLFTSLGMYNVNDVYEGTFLQIFLLQILIVGITFLIEMSFCTLIIFFYALYLTIKRYIGRVAIIMSAFVFFVANWAFFSFVESGLYQSLFYYGEVNLTPLINYLPTAKTIVFSTTGGSIFLVEELIAWLFSIGLFIIGSKWTEKVVLK